MIVSPLQRMNYDMKNESEILNEVIRFLHFHQHQRHCKFAIAATLQKKFAHLIFVH